MKNMTVRLDEEEIEDLEAEADAAGESRSEYVRSIIRARDAADSDRDSAAESAMLREALSRLEGEIERLHTENERLTRQLEAVPAPALAGKQSDDGLLHRTKRRLFGVG